MINRQQIAIISEILDSVGLESLKLPKLQIQTIIPNNR